MILESKKLECWPSLRFTVFGHPQPQGSMRAFMPKGWKRPVLTSDNKKLKPWRQEVTSCAIVAMQESGFKKIERETPVAIWITFFLAKPKSAKKRRYPTVKPDMDKLERAVCDALTGVAYQDDAQIVRCVKEKFYGDPERTEIAVEEAI